jgi:hypothetical protein
MARPYAHWSRLVRIAPAHRQLGPPFPQKGAMGGVPVTRVQPAREVLGDASTGGATLTVGNAPRSLASRGEQRARLALNSISRILVGVSRARDAGSAVAVVARRATGACTGVEEAAGGACRHRRRLGSFWVPSQEPRIRS